jgi:threonine/homoserine/homoserine lactone efflux protein
MMTELPLFCLAVMAVLATPGPTNALLCTSAGLVGGIRSVPLILPELAGYGIAIALMRLVGGPLIAAVPSFGLVLRLALVGYLLLLSWRLWQTNPALLNKDRRVITLGQVFLTTLLNPKALVFAFVLFPPADAGISMAPYALVFALTVVCVAIGWMAFGAVIGRLGGNSLDRLLPRLAAVALTVIACVVAGSTLAARI